MTKKDVYERICKTRNSRFYQGIIIVPSNELELPSIRKVKELLSNMNPYKPSIINIDSCFISPLSITASDDTIVSLIDSIFDNNELTSVDDILFC